MLMLLGWLAVFGFLLVALAGVTWIFLPNWLSKTFGSIEPGNAYRDGLPRIIGFPIVAIGAAGAIVTALQAIEAFTSAQESAYQDQYRKGFDSIGNSNIAVRIGGLYALQDLLGRKTAHANDEKSTSPAVIILRALAALAVDSSQKSENSDGAVPADVSTALGIIGSGIKEIESNHGLGTLWPSLDLRQGKFAGSVVVSRDLSHTDFRHADLRGSDFFKTKFYESNLRFAQMQGINGSGADFSHAGLSNASFARGVNWAVPAMETGDLIGSQLSGSTFYNVSGENVKFDGACLAGAIFNNADIRDATFDKADLYGAQFKAARLSGLPDKNLSFDRANLIEAKFTADESNAVLTNVSFESADLRKADFSGAILTNVTFHRANLTDAHFEGAVLSNVHFDEAVLARTAFKDAKLTGTSFGGALLQGAVFNGTTLDEVIMTSICGSALPGDRVAVGYCEAPPANPPPVNPVDPHACL